MFGLVFDIFGTMCIGILYDGIMQPQYNVKAYYFSVGTFTFKRVNAVL